MNSLLRYVVQHVDQGLLQSALHLPKFPNEAAGDSLLF